MTRKASRAAVPSMCMLALLLSAGCTATGDRPAGHGSSSAATSASAALPDAGLPPADARDAMTDAPTDADDSALARYHRGEWAIQRNGGTVLFETYGTTECKPLPAERPKGLSIYYLQRGYEPGDMTYFGLTDAASCRFAWALIWLDPPQAACRVTNTTALDKLYAELHKLQLHAIRSKDLHAVSPHRGGRGLVMRWPGSHCEVSDMGSSEVDEADRGRFDAALEAFRNAYEAAKVPGSR